jgi:DNA-binding transcriptional LysR family regulator
VDYNAEEDLSRLFAGLGLAQPNVVLWARSAMSIMVGLAHTDLLAMLPMQWGEFAMTRDTLQVVPIREVLPAPPIVCIRRPDLPLTPAAEFFLDLLLRHQPAERRARGRA